MFHYALLLAGLFSGPLLQSSPPAPALVEGVVTNKITGAPVKEAHVMCMKTGSAIKTDTDNAGHFALQLEPGSYQVWAEHLGFARQSYGAHTTNGSGTVIALSPGQKLELTIPMSPYGVIAGRVFDEDGDPLQGASIQVLRFSYTKGRRELIPVYGTSSNDRGEYRAYGIPAGHYFLQATRRDRTYAALYYPGVLDLAAASEVPLPEGDEVDGADFQMRKFQLLPVRGRVLSPAPGFAAGQLQVVLARGDGEVVSSSNRLSANVDLATGSFEFPAVAPGSYLLVASQLYGKLALAGRVPLEVRDMPPADVTVPLTSGFALNGRLEVEGGGALPSVTFGLRPVEGLALGQRTVTASSAAGQIRFPGITPGIWELTFDPLPDRFCVKAATFNEVDLLRDMLNLVAGPRGEIHILLSDKCSQISGTVAGADGQPHSATVILAPAESELRSAQSYRIALAQAQGTFAFKAVRPGSYKLFALEEVEPFAWLDPQLLESIESKGQLVSVSEGDQATRRLESISPEALLPAH